jgi:hypothetical protein
MPEHHREGEGPVSDHDVPVGHADAGRAHLDPDFASLGGILLQLHDLERLVDGGKDGAAGLHGGTSELESL